MFSFWSSSLIVILPHMKLPLRRLDGLSQFHQNLLQLFQHLERIVVSLLFSRLPCSHNLCHHALSFDDGGTYNFVVCDQVIVRALAILYHSAALSSGIGHQCVTLFQKGARIAHLFRECRAEMCNCICEFLVLDETIAKQPAAPLPHLINAVDNVL